MTQKQIKLFRTVFATAVGVLELGKTINEIHGGRGLDDRASQVLALHKQGLAECEKESPDADVIADVLKQLEELAEQRLPKFPAGGIVSMPQIPAVKNAVNRQSRIDELVYMARKAGKTESDISDCLSDILSPLSVEQRLNKLIG